VATSAAASAETSPDAARPEGGVQQDSGDAGSEAPDSAPSSGEAGDVAGEQAPGEQIAGEQASGEQASDELTDSSGAEAADSSGPGRRELPDTLTFRITRTAWIAVISVAVCATPVATSHAWLLWVYLLPIALGFWVARMRTTVGADGATVRHMTGTARFTWDDVQSVKLDARGWSEAVLVSGQHVKLPAVRVRDLSLLSEMSRGRIPDPAR